MIKISRTRGGTTNCSMLGSKNHAGGVLLLARLTATGKDFLYRRLPRVRGGFRIDA
jgi:hypothetical protein